MTVYLCSRTTPHPPLPLPLPSGVSIAILDHYECVGWENLSMYCKVQSSDAGEVKGGTSFSSKSPGLYTAAGLLCASTSMMLIMFCCCRLWRRWWIPSGYEQDDRSINRTLLNAKTSIGRSLLWLRYGITGLYSDYFGMDRGKWFWPKMYVFNSYPKAVILYFVPFALQHSLALSSSLTHAYPLMYADSSAKWSRSGCNLQR